ncbi:MAG: flippase-like domain-containing protein [Candidatus Cloacimonetes bacterium]|nr:flippase-like domain-containing protein [Candidatus Cloacimonadota bacterium]MCF7812849.1 flippase-like domain-containing protein [Candidatus Cloacimonadota bacterium]MCF7867061.1 flippase-like domain-containing protein [Candidatus Cloacimonadota bacterium]MCF7882619.1 flippase-like domain-containing protein [Candidatus Cloacimonadota bacterium]
MQRLLKNRLFFYFKIVVTIIILYFVFRKIDLVVLINSFKQISLPVILAMFITTVIKIYIEYKNWGHYLSINPDYKLRPRDIFKSHMIGHSLSLIIPGGLGVAGKVFFLDNSKGHTFMSLGVEKFFQIWINLLFASFAAIFYFRKMNILIPIVVFVFVIFLPLFIYWIKHLNRRKSIEKYFREYIKILPRVSFMQITYMFITIFQYFVLVNVFLKYHIFSAIISVPLILSSNLIPITYAGLGLREKFAIEIFSKYAISSEIAVAVTLTIFLFNSVLPALVGIVLFMRKK